MAFNPPPFIIEDEDEFDNIPKVNCKYYAPERVATVMNSSKGNFSVFSMNIRSCRKNFISLATFLNTYLLKFSLIVLVETWLSADSDEGFYLNGYNQYNLYRNNYGDGIKIFYNDSFSFNVLHNFTFVNEFFEVLTFYLRGRNFKYLICCVYRSPAKNPNVFNDMFVDQVLDKFPPNSDIILVGDFNINLYNPLNLRYISQFVNNILSYNYFPIINIATKINENNPITKYSLIDHLWSNFKKGYNHTSGVIDYLISDHLPIFYFFSNSYNFISEQTLKFRPMSNFNTQNFITSISNIDFSPIYSSDNPNDAFSSFYDVLFQTFNSAFPIKTKKVNRNNIDKPY